MFLEEATFEKIIASTPLVSIDLIVKNPQGEYLLGFRTNRPAQNYWFAPGGRVRKNERLEDAFSRLCDDELGIRKLITEARFVGPYQHFYDDSVFGTQTSTHYVVLAYEIQVDLPLKELPNAQHSNYRFFDKEEILQNDLVHAHTKWYFER